MYKDIYRHLFATYGRQPRIWFGFATAIIQSFVVRVYVVIIMAQVTSSIAAGDLESAKRYTLYYLVSYIVGSIIGATGELIAVSTENQQYSETMRSFHKKLVGKDMSFYQDNQTGYLTTAFRQYLDSSLLLSRFWRGEALGALISLTVPTAVLLVAAPKVGLVAILVVIVQFLYVAWSSSKARQYRAISHEAYRKITGEVSDQITNIVAFKSGGVEERAYKAMQEFAKQEAGAFWSRHRTVILFNLPRGIITATGISFAIYMIISDATATQPATLGLIVLTLTYMFQIIRNMAALPELIDTHDNLITKLYPTLKYLDDEHELIQDPVQPKPLRITEAAISIEGIDFSYRSHSEAQSKIPIFKGLTIRIKGGEQVGIVGLSGAGKSTLANLLLRFNDVENGSIMIDGIDIRDVPQSQLRQKIAYVPQEPLLFHRTIQENITYYNPKASDDEVVRVAKAAHAHEFIQELPDTYNTIVGERGVKLSGGQKQRIAIARAILKKAPIILFDEATSALDSESEQIIQEALPDIIGKQTAIVIAHRLSTVAKLDRIIVMHKGEIVEEGIHEELIKHQGRYHSLWLKQTRSMDQPAYS